MTDDTVIPLDHGGRHEPGKWWPKGPLNVAEVVDVAYANTPVARLLGSILDDQVAIHEAVRKVMVLHRPMPADRPEDPAHCEHCTRLTDRYWVEWPCPTMQLLEGIVL